MKIPLKFVAYFVRSSVQGQVFTRLRKTKMRDLLQSTYVQLSVRMYVPLTSETTCHIQANEARYL